MKLGSPGWLGRGLPIWLTSAVLVLIATLAWFGYRAVLGWRANATLLAQRRAREMGNLLVSAITRDMRGVQSVVLQSMQADGFMLDPPYDVGDIAASAFARYPYPESFFAWRGTATPQSVVFYDRADRRPRWARDAVTSNRFPVLVESHPEVAKLLIEHITADANRGHRFSTFDLQLDGVPYQVVTRLLYRDPLREELEAAFGFTVNLSWVRTDYFGDLTRQVAHIGQAAGLSLFVLDDRGRGVVSLPNSARGEASFRREFPIQFSDPLLVEHDSTPRSWAVETGIAHDPTLAEAVRASDRILLMLACAAAALAIGLILTLRATRASARLAEIRSDFVSTVTHELKTPIATIRAIGDTLARERVTDPEARLRYAQVVVQESKRLSRLVDNLLAYSRITDTTDAYLFGPVAVRAILEQALRTAKSRLETGG
ncbi:MAG: histidine kinase dimerization/phospho-acceptor domain-containing protein, partial [Acidobacteriota bacterium]